MTPALSGGAATLVSALAAAAAVLALSSADPGSRRVARLVGGTSAPGASGAVVVAAGEPEVRGRGLAAVAAALGALVLVDGPTGLALAVVVGPLTYRMLRQLEPRAVVAEREWLARDLPVAAHLLASAVAAGASPVGAIDLVGAVIGGPVAPHLRRVAALARLGGDLGVTWRSVPRDSGLAPLARTVARALATGAPLADALDRLAVDLRSQRRFEIDRRARSVGVRAAAPLGLCFLPAFLLIGVVPVVIGVATTVFATVQ